MIQCFAPNGFESSFISFKKPRLISASKIDSYYTVHPRVLHKHNDLFEMLFVCSGTGIYIIEETRYPIQEGDLILCNAGTLHDEDPSCSDNLNTLSIATTDIARDNLPPNHMIETGSVPVIPSGEFKESIQGIMMTIYGMLANDPKEHAEVCHHLNLALLGILVSIIRRNRDGKAPQSPANIIAAQVKSYINTHYDEDFTLQDIADAIHVTPYHLSHVFKDVTGYSPKQYTLRRRLGEAQTLLITTDLNMTEISTRVGFGNQSHFNSMFRKYIGMSPGDYRNSYVQEHGWKTDGEKGDPVL